MGKQLIAAALAVLLAACGHASAKMPVAYGLGRPADPAEAAAQDIDVAPTGTGLPPGRGDAVAGSAVFATSCRTCHGVAIRLSPQRWPYATTLFDYVRRAMPPAPSRRLDPNAVYAVVAYELFMNRIITQGETLDPTTLPRVTMPGNGDFIEHP